jgi:hypothetical protein
VAERLTPSPRRIEVRKAAVFLAVNPVAQERQVVAHVARDELGDGPLPLVRRDANVRAVLDDMGVRDDRPIRCDEKSGAGGDFLVWLGRR